MTVGITSQLVGKFVNAVEVVPRPQYPQLHKVRLNYKIFLQVEVLKNITYYAIIKSPVMQVVQFSGKDIITKIFDALNDKGGTRLLPEDFRALCDGAAPHVRARAICDFIAGMTDRYAFELYGRLFGTDFLTVHKPF
jgi:dGTPase